MSLDERWSQYVETSYRNMNPEAWGVPKTTKRFLLLTMELLAAVTRMPTLQRTHERLLEAHQGFGEPTSEAYVQNSQAVFRVAERTVWCLGILAQEASLALRFDEAASRDDPGLLWHAGELAELVARDLSAREIDLDARKELLQRMVSCLHFFLRRKDVWEKILVDGTSREEAEKPGEIS